MLDRRLGIAAALAAALLLGTPGAATGAFLPAPAGRAAPTRLARLTRATRVFARPQRASKPVAVVAPTRPITGEQTVLPVIGRATDDQGAAWLRVLLPGRPNGHSGWIGARGIATSVDEFQIFIHVAARDVRVDEAGVSVRVFRAVVGKASTPTPMGHFFVEESVALGRWDVGAPFALALSARSNVLQEFAGGPGQIALHGTGNVGGRVGTAISHGCIRLTTPAITWLGTWIPPGTLVTITP